MLEFLLYLQCFAYCFRAKRDANQGILDRIRFVSAVSEPGEQVEIESWPRSTIYGLIAGREFCSEHPHSPAAYRIISFHYVSPDEIHIRMVLVPHSVGYIPAARFTGC